mmetsp:Transcript_2472/g.9058  ORF Transcript_2472/g.9058 Transcript_2472/m.9058 type:complete len:205 (+) Transcript_2472:456-1070(+)
MTNSFARIPTANIMLAISSLACFQLRSSYSTYLLRDASRCDDAGCRNELNAYMDPNLLEPIRRYRRARDVTSYGTPMWCHLRRAERRIRTTLSTRRTAGSLHRGLESTTNINARHALIVVARSRASPRVAWRNFVRISRCTQRSVERKPPHGRRAVESTSDDEMKSLQIVMSRHGPIGCARRRRRRASSCADEGTRRRLDGRRA